ncbi:nucleus accumbens-associated protein 2 isoform X2 [Alosa alosa]|uniref:nucleus accumbens-associated protein 2 isoform X2 n=1 Tax=Alosa alosa TaxID=278164 RepID=UPI0020150AC4|nr:nucleus accumbens-associated protein 2 isoform X2 [Alosa alosa]
MSHLLHMEIPNFGSAVLDSLNEQRLLGQHCDVAIMVNGQAFKAHRAVLAASSLYFRDLFSGSGQALFELPSSVTTSCFQQILSFCYTGKMTVSASDQLMVMYTAGYLQIQNIVERGMDLMFKANAPPYCDSQTPAGDDSAGGSPPPLPDNQHPPPMPTAMPACDIKQEKVETPLCSQSEEARSSSGGGEGKGGGSGGGGSRGMVPRGSALFYSGVGANGGLLGVYPYDLVSGENTSPGASSLPATDSPTSHQNEDEDLEEDTYDGLPSAKKLYGYSINPYGKSRYCVLLGGDREALPASLISQIGYRCHPALYTEGDPGERLELIAGKQIGYRCHPALYTEGDPGERLELITGSGVFMTRGQLMNCHLCAGIKHKVLLRRLLAAFFDRNTLADSCGTGIRSSNCDPSRKPLDSRILNTVKLYCQNFAPNFKESEMNVIAADMCTNARRVRKRWLPKIKSMLPEAMEAYRSAVVVGPAETAPAASTTFPFEAEFKHLTTAAGLQVEPHLYGDARDPLRTLPHFPGQQDAKAPTAAEQDNGAESVKGREDSDEARGRAEATERGVLNIHHGNKKADAPSSSPPAKAHSGEQPPVEKDLPEEQ